MIINNIANINFGGGGGSDLKLKDVQEATYTANGTYSVLPDDGYDGMSKVNVDINVPEKEPNLYQYGTSVGTNEPYWYQLGMDEENKSFDVPDGYDGLKPFKLTANLFKYGVQQNLYDSAQELTFSANTTWVGGGVTEMAKKVIVDVPQKEEQVKSMSTAKNGYYVIEPDSGKTISKATVSINVPIEINLNDGMSFAFSPNLVDNWWDKYSIVGGEKRSDWSHFFSNCNYLQSVSFYKINISSAATNMSAFYNNCSNLTDAYFNHLNIDTSQVTDMSYMFYGCERIENIDLSYFNTSQVTDMSYMFYDCMELKTLNISNFYVSDRTILNNMFYLDSNLESVDVSNCESNTKNLILQKLQTDLSSYTWTLGDDGIITRSEKTS